MGVLGSSRLVINMKLSAIILMASAVTASQLSVNEQEHSSALIDSEFRRMLAKSWTYVDGEKLGYGCYKSTCWAFCGIRWTMGAWCYTVSKGMSSYKRCSKDSDCLTRKQSYIEKCKGGCTW